MMWLLRMAMSMLIGWFVGRLTHEEKWPIWFGMAFVVFIVTLANVVVIHLFGV